MAIATKSKAEPLELLFGGALVEQLGAQLYPSATATVAELISNAWDADAEHIWITIPFGTEWPEKQIVAIDDGCGMSRVDAQKMYLVVGRKKRQESGPTSPRGRKVHGRKGIGKLAAFGTAGVLECATSKDGEFTSFRLDYDEIRKLKPTEKYPAESAEDESPLKNPDTGATLAHGTRITLSRLNLKRVIAQRDFIESMSRRFALRANEMKVSINGSVLKRFSVPTQIRFPKDGRPAEAALGSGGKWATESLPDGKEVRWWIGFTETPIKDEALQGITIFANGKMAQRPFKFERGQGVTGQLGQEYLVGEVEADWVDEGVSIEDDLIQSNRDQLQLEDPRLDALIEWGRGRLAWALRERQRIRDAENLKQYEQDEEIKEMLADCTPAERSKYLTIARTASKVPEMMPDDVKRLMEDVLNARGDRIIREMLDQITASDDDSQAEMWGLVHQFGLIDARRTKSLVEARLATIKRLKTAIEDGSKEIPDIHNIILDNTWLLDPRWHLLDDELKVKKLGIDFESETDGETGQQMDYLFVLRPRPPWKVDEVVVVEIKRGTHPDGSVRKADAPEVEKFHDYVLAAQAHYQKNSKAFVPGVRGLMIAQDYTSRADVKRKSLETLRDTRLEFKTWESVIDETERMHVGWLEIATRRSESTVSEIPAAVGKAKKPEETRAGRRRSARSKPAKARPARTRPRKSGSAKTAKRRRR